MKHVPFATDLLLQLLVPICPKPVRCPYCPVDVPVHWTLWGSYARYAGDPDDPGMRVDVPRYWCKIVRQSFSLVPDALLPYCGTRTGFVLQWLHELLVRGVAVNTLARRFGVARGTLRYLRVRFLRTLPKLRLPGHEGFRNAAEFLTALAQAGAAAVAELFRVWKQREPKFCVVGIYLR